MLTLMLQIGSLCFDLTRHLVTSGKNCMHFWTTTSASQGNLIKHILFLNSRLHYWKWAIFYFICLHATTFILSRISSLIERIRLKILERPLSWLAKYCFFAFSLLLKRVTCLSSLLSSYHSTSCHVDKDTFPASKIGTMEKHKISRKVIDWKCSSIFKAHALWQGKTIIYRYTDIFRPGSIVH